MHLYDINHARRKMSTWQNLEDGWKMLPLSNGWMFLIDPSVKKNQGYDVYLSKQSDVLTDKQLFTTHGHIRHATRMCERLKKNNDWKKYLPIEPVRKKSTWRTKLSSILITLLAFIRPFGTSTYSSSTSRK